MIRLKDLLQEQDNQDTQAYPIVNIPILRQGSRGEAVKKIQRHLINMGYLPAKTKSGKDSDDGIFGPGTKAAVLAFQKFAFPGQPKEHDGIVGKNTARSLMQLDYKETEPDPVEPELTSNQITKRQLNALTMGIIPDFVLQFLFPTPMSDSDFGFIDRKVMGAVIKNHIVYQGGNPNKDSIEYVAYDQRISNLLDGKGGFNSENFGKAIKSIITGRSTFGGIKLLLKLKMALLFGRFTYEKQENGSYRILPDPYDFSKGGSIKIMPTEAEVAALEKTSGGTGLKFQLRLLDLLIRKNKMFKGSVRGSNTKQNFKDLIKYTIADRGAYSFGEWYRALRALRSVTDPDVGESSGNVMAMSGIDVDLPDTIQGGGAAASKMA